MQFAGAPVEQAVGAVDVLLWWGAGDLGVVGLEGLEGANPLDPVARHLLPPLLLSPEEDALTALERMAERGYARALVVEGDRLLGVLSKTDLLRAFQVRLLGLSYLDRPKGPE